MSDLRVAIVGSGPAGFYAASSLLAVDRAVEVDMFDRLPTPWGLVRLGVAPDHPNIKAVSRAFEKTARLPGYRFLGNVEVGRDISHTELAGLYDAVIYAFGAQADRRLGIPGEDLAGSWAATELVAWYNGHPDFQDLSFDLSADRAIVIGNGNVALDVARMLALTEEELASTDTTDLAIAAIVGSRIQEIVVVGRRGPVQAAWTPPELAELGELAGADVVVDPAELVLDPVSEAELDAADHIVKRNLEVLGELARRSPAGKKRRVVLQFRRSPTAILGGDRVEAIELAQNELEPDGRGSVRAVATDERATLASGVVFRSVGYRGLELENVPFDEATGTMPNDGGRVLDVADSPLRGVYCAGWIKRGPTGVIGTNKKDASETVELLLADADAGTIGGCGAGAGDVDALLAARGVEVVTQAGWEAIDAAERALGEPHGRPRVKLTSWDELLAAARG